MLSELLNLLRSGGTYRVQDLAQALDTTPALVEMMLEELSRTGHLRPVSGACPGQCAGCPTAGSCTVESGGRMWTLTAKGGVE